MSVTPCARVLFVTSVNPTLHPFVDQQIGLLKRRGVDVRVICRVHAAASPRDDLIYDGYLGRSPSRGEMFRAAPLLLARAAMDPAYRRFLAAEARRSEMGLQIAAGRAWHWDRIARLAQAWRPELIHVHFAWHLSAAIPFAQYIDVPIVCTAHASDIYFEDDWAKNLSHPSVAQVITVAESVNDYMLERCPGLAAKTTRIMNPLNPAFLSRPAARPESLRIVNVASFKKIKNQAWLVRALALLDAKGIDFSCTFIGVGDELQAIRTQVTRAGLDTRVAFAGWRSHDEVLQAMDASSVFVLSSESEGLPTVITEAIARSRAVVATDLPSTRDASSSGQYATLVPLNDDESLAAAILTAHLEAATNTARAEAGRGWVEAEFHPDTHWRHLDRVYRRALGRN